ncbi:MAG: hypothetical protein A2X94_13935 [Bdellovibrionales bacterium GWB1_55_8]|nr:MAG: hypothetical protein A2X94_13935 [Bdellovibrionales bacterium GWB1_55_8]
MRKASRLHFTALPDTISPVKKIILLGIAGLLLVAGMALAASSKTLAFKVKAVLQGERSLFGGLGGSGKPAGCIFDVQISSKPISNLSLPCGSSSHFTMGEGWVYVFTSPADEYFVCPKATFSESACIECGECRLKKDELKRLNVLNR